MSVAPGTRLGPYEIVALAGAGGMGEVYRARDTRLGRDIAIKVLPAHVAADPEFRQRLQREARAVSSLSHPNICALYDVGHQDGLDFLVMEYLEGETLAVRLTRGPLPLDQVFRYGIEIADALTAAHRTGLVHRDLKPGNVMLTRTGARLLDFGLARPARDVRGASSVPEVTASAPLTAQGTVIGTMQYMSPEQVEGRELDARSDIFALGAVLYEMTTGRRAFDGTTTTSLIAAILARDPAPIVTVQPLAPAALDDIVRGCLAKEPDERWQTAHDISLQLQALRRRASEHAPGLADASAETPARSLRPALWWFAAAAVSAAVIAVWALLGGSGSAPASPPETPLVRASLLPPAAHSFVPNDFAISPDGRRVAFVAAGADGVATLWIMSLESSQAIEIAGSETAEAPFWSPDSRWIAFFTQGKLMKVELGGMGLQTICEATVTARVGAWNQTDDIVFANAVFGPLFRVKASGGTAVPVTAIPADMPGEAHRFPQFLPDGKRFLYTVSWTNQQRGGVYLSSLDGGAPSLLSSDIRSRVVLAAGHLVFVSGGMVFAQPFDADAARFTGEPRPLLRNEIGADWRFGDMPLSASENGIVVYQSRATYHTQLVWFDRTGRELGAVGQPGFSSPALSPDGTRVAVTHDQEGTGQTNVWMHDLRRNISTALNTAGIDTAPAWSPDGRWLAYSSIREGNGLFRRPIDGSGPEETLHQSPAHLLVNSYSPDGSRVLVMDFARGMPELRAYEVATGESEVLEIGAEASYSPDGRWLAHLGFPAIGVKVRSADRPGGFQASASGSQPRWRRDMSELFYIAPDKKMMSVPLTIRGGVLEPGAPVPLFQTRIVQPRLVLFQYDVTPDGERFLINSLPREDAAAPLTMLVNWTAALGRSPG